VLLPSPDRHDLHGSSSDNAAQSRLHTDCSRNQALLLQFGLNSRSLYLHTLSQCTPHAYTATTVHHGLHSGLQRLERRTCLLTLEPCSHSCLQTQRSGLASLLLPLHSQPIQHYAGLSTAERCLQTQSCLQSSSLIFRLLQLRVHSSTLNGPPSTLECDSTTQLTGLLLLQPEKGFRSQSRHHSAGHMPAPSALNGDGCRQLTNAKGFPHLRDHVLSMSSAHSRLNAHSCGVLTLSQLFRLEHIVCVSERGQLATGGEAAPSSLHGVGSCSFSLGLSSSYLSSMLSSELTELTTGAPHTQCTLNGNGGSSSLGLNDALSFSGLSLELQCTQVVHLTASLPIAYRTLHLHRSGLLSFQSLSTQDLQGMHGL